MDGEQRWLKSDILSEELKPSLPLREGKAQSVDSTRPKSYDNLCNVCGF